MWKMWADGSAFWSSLSYTCGPVKAVRAAEPFCFGALLPTMTSIRGFHAPAVLATLLVDPCVGRVAGAPLVGQYGLSGGCSMVPEQAHRRGRLCRGRVRVRSGWRMAEAPWFLESNCASVPSCYALGCLISPCRLATRATSTPGAVSV